jgi:hypothetical protein
VGERVLERARSKTSGLKAVSKGSCATLQAATSTSVIDVSSDDIEGRLRLLAHTLHEPPLRPHLLCELREVVPTLGVYFSKVHKEAYNNKVANMTQLGTLVSQLPHERRTRVWSAAWRPCRNCPTAVRLWPRSSLARASS